jgi:hypothetical protein
MKMADWGVKLIYLDKAWEKNRMLRTTILSFLLFASVPAAVCDAPLPNHSLRESLAAKQLPLDSAKLANLDKNITSGAELDDANQFVIAYYVDDGTGMMQPPLYVDRYDKKRAEWKSAALSDTGVEAVDTPCFGSVLSVKAVGNHLFLDTNVSPSAGCTLVLSGNFKLEASLYGWLLGRLGEDTLVYQRSEVHFAPVHPTEIAIYDLRAKRDATIFPPKPDPAIRRARTAQLKEFYKGNEEWCKRNNDPCDPEDFDSELHGGLVTNEAEAALAFLISYEQIQYAQGQVQKPSGPKDVLYVYRRVNEEAKMEYREILLKDAKARFGTETLQSLIQPEILQKIFAEALPK